ncbi:phage major capsid protein [Herbaspirillum sp. SJZ107]|uniref:phage major capsid protein n=1 Tax=Herbaspirillum sp. SJZ107 TaxID=2572881 RepID=UPI0011706BB7|nr:phage major capsid protein [Herbaspirillum sp. SJZ107]TQK10243.1 HK97 family phage major capsid protein [Herbaspirillum sp. SJZ107]
MADKDAAQEVMEAFNEFKRTNDANLQKRSADLDAKLDKINAALDKHEANSQQLTLIEKQNKAIQDQVDAIEKIANRAGLGGNSDPAAKAAQEYMEAFNRVMRKPSGDRDPVDMAMVRERQAALIKTDDASAGYLLAPPEMQKEIIKNVIELTPMRALATVRSIGVGSLKMPKKTGNGSASRVGETAQRNNTGDPAYGMLEFFAPEMFARIEVSQQMLEDADYDLFAELQEDASEQFAVREGLESISGTGGSAQMEGILTSTDIGFTLSGAAADLTADGLISLYHDLKTAHARNAVWGLNRNTLGKVRKLKDTNNQYLWAPGIANGVPNTILGSSYAEMADMPNVAANSFPIVFADFKKLYVIVDRVNVSLQADYTTGADHGLVVFRARRRVGGGVRQAEAGRKLKIAAS